MGRIAAILPHRGAALLVDDVIDICPRTGSGVIESAFTTTTVSNIRERLASADTPEWGDKDTVPSLFVLEAFAQGCGIVWATYRDNADGAHSGLILGAATDVHFHMTSRAGETLHHRIVVDSDLGTSATFSGEIVAAADGTRIATVGSLLAVRGPAGPQLPGGRQ